MKKFFTFLLLAGILVTPNVFADENDGNNNGNSGGNNNENTGGDNNGDNNGNNDGNTTPPGGPISIGPMNPTPDPGKINPCSLSPIEGWYENGCVEIFFSRNMGVAFVTVTNTNTGDMWYSAADSCDGVILVDINPTSGNYAITIETQFSGTYYGAFAL